MSYRSAPCAILAVVLAAACSRSSPPAPDPRGPVDADSFTLIVLPDTQGYVDGKRDTFERQTAWIADNAARLRLAYVAHVGDIVNWNVDREWQIARRALATLDEAGVPYALSIGNHDMGRRGSASDRTTGLHDHFPVTQLADRPGFAGVFEPGKAENSFHTFSAAGTDWLIVVVEFGPRDEVLAWAGSVLDQHAERRAIIVTHAYMYSDGTRQGEGDDFHPGTKGMAKIPGNTINDGEQMWDKLVRRHANVQFVLSGHVTHGGASRLTSQGDANNPVHQILSNYQDYDNAGDGWLRIMRFSPKQGRVYVWTYSPTRDQFKTGKAHQFQLALSP